MYTEPCHKIKEDPAYATDYQVFMDDVLNKCYGDVVP